MSEVCPECGSNNVTGNFKGDPGGSTFFRCQNCGQGFRPLEDVEEADGE